MTTPEDINALSSPLYSGSTLKSSTTTATRYKPASDASPHSHDISQPASDPSQPAQPPAAPGGTTFRYPPHYSFPPFYTLQPNLTTRASQLASWSALVLAYCAHHRTFRMTPSHALFANEQLGKRLAPDDAKAVLDAMAERGRATWLDARTREEAWVWWRTGEEWAGLVAAWVDATGQKNTVLTLYELREGDATAKEDFHGVPEEVLKSALQVLVKRGKASVFGDEDQLGVKFY